MHISFSTIFPERSKCKYSFVVSFYHQLKLDLLHQVELDFKHKKIVEIETEKRLLVGEKIGGNHILLFN